jgi:hypothetical protein
MKLLVILETYAAEPPEWLLARNGKQVYANQSYVVNQLEPLPFGPTAVNPDDEEGGSISQKFEIRNSRICHSGVPSPAISSAAWLEIEYGECPRRATDKRISGYSGIDPSRTADEV